VHLPCAAGNARLIVGIVVRAIINSAIMRTRRQVLWTSLCVIGAIVVVIS